jgi:hypothetical protein
MAIRPRNPLPEITVFFCGGHFTCLSVHLVQKPMVNEESWIWKSA